MAVCSAQTDKPSRSTAQLQERITGELRKYPSARFGIAFKDLESGDTFFFNEDSSFHAASTMKTPVMAEVFTQAKTGKLSIDDSVIVYNNFKSIVDGSLYRINAADDSEQTLYSKIGTGVKISDLLLLMITKSSNLATNILIDKVGAKAVNQTMQSLGAKNMQILRGVEDQKAFDLGMNNVLSPKDLMLLFERLASGTLVSKQSSEQMVAILMQQQLKGAIPAKLPKGLPVANKTGSITRVLNDSGIVFLPDGRKYVLVLLSAGLEHEQAMAALSNISLYMYEYMLPL